MTKEDIITQLVAKGYNNDASATQQDLYTTIKRGQLFSNSNRLNAGWARGKYVIASIDNSQYTEKEYVKQWISKVSKYKDQYLCLEMQEMMWVFYDSSGNQISFVVNSPKLPQIKSEMYNYDTERESQLSDNYCPYITAIKSKPFLLLAGISGTGKSRIVREFAFKSCPKYLQDKDGTTPGNYCLIEVKPNWHDSTELLGYYSNLNQKYQFTKFAKFLVKAKMFPDVPFFVCLDEMNLAPVEQYFAEILSILETRKHPKDNQNTIKTEPVIEARYFQELEQLKGMRRSDTGEPFKIELTDRDVYLKLYGIDTENDIDKEVGERQDLTTEGLTLPDNVIIIGTVNMDDTTHQFSRKVIDRAMTIEMNGGKLADMYGGSKDLEYLDEEEQQKWQLAFKQHYVTADEVLEKHPEMAKDITEKLPKRLEEINEVLKGTPFKVSYRVLNELTIMVGVMLDEKGEDADIDDIINQAVNNILLMKILPRIEGDSEMFAIKGSNETRLDRLKEIAPNIEPEEESEHRQTAKDKIQEMIDRLDNQEFTRFWP